MLSRAKNRLYEIVGDFDFIEFISGFEFVSWIEAGCHNGLDTKKMLSIFPNVLAYGFEPDRVAFSEASSNLAAFGNRILLSHLALSDSVGELSMRIRDELGSGNTIFVKDSTESLEKIKCSTLDDELRHKELGRSALWLDVEGHAVQVLRGAIRTLRFIDFAKIEVQMHDMSADRIADAFEVISIMKRGGLRPRFLPIHPGYFGDILFVRSSKMTLRERVVSFLYLFIFEVLHKYIYPALKTPPKYNK